MTAKLSIGGEDTSSVPTGEAAMIACRQCQRPSPPNRRFCGGCGHNLWERCPQCGTECPQDERFCGSCGADVLGSLAEQSRQLQRQLDDARHLMASFRYDAAIAVLHRVAETQDPRFERFVAQARGDLASLEADRQTRLSTAGLALDCAKAALEACDYEAAEAQIAAVPGPLRCEEHETLLERARACQQELLDLSADIRTAIAAKETSDLLPKLDRLLQLRPDHGQAQRLVAQLLEHRLKSARRSLAKHDFRVALDSLSQIPPLLRNEETEKAIETASELHTSLIEIREAALADVTQLALAERLCKLVPSCNEAADLRRRIAERMAAQPADRRLGAINWTAPPARSLLGMPVDWLTSFARVPVIDEASRTALAQHPGQFLVALGMALQGMEAAAIDIELAPADQQNVLSRLQSIQIGRRLPTAAWGLDLSDYGLKAIKLTRDKSGALQVEACLHFAHRRPLTQVAVEMERPELIEETLGKFVSQAGERKGVRIAVGMPGLKVLGRFFELPPMPAKKVADSVQYEARHQLPIALEELAWSYHIQGTLTGKEADAVPRRVMLQACRQTQLRDRIGLFKSAGIQPDVVQSDCLALHNAVSHEWFGEGQPAEPIALFDVGTDASNVVISAPGVVWFRTVGHGGEQLTRELVKQFQLTSEQAELLKCQPARARRFCKLHEALASHFVQFGSELERSLATHHKLFPDAPARRVLGLGGAFQTFGLLKYLRSGK